MRKFLLWIAGLGALGLAVAFVVTDPAFLRLIHARNTQVQATPPDLANGKAMFNAGGCASCHAAPGQADRTRLGGGLALHSPFGTFHAPNISAHPRDGIGNWTPTDFVRAMREGVSPDGRHYYPSFPYTSYQRMTTRDLTDLFGYIRSLAAVEGRARDHELPFPFNIRRLLGGWKLLYLDGKPFMADAARDAAWNRGAYLVEGPGHCAECHSPRDPLGGIVSAKRFAGGPDPEGKGTVPNITPHKDGISGWTAGEMATFLKTGDTPGFVNVGGSMGSVIKNMAELPEADIQAMAAYLVSLKPIEGKPVAPAKK